MELHQGKMLASAVWIGATTDHEGVKWTPMTGEQGGVELLAKAGKVAFYRRGESRPVETDLHNVLFIPPEAVGSYSVEIRMFEKVTSASPFNESFMLCQSLHQARIRAAVGAVYHASVNAVERVEWSIYRYGGFLDEGKEEVERGTGHFFVQGAYTVQAEAPT